MSATLASEHGSLPLAPIETPDSLFARLLFSAMRKRYGLVPTAFRVLYARSPYLAFLSLVIVLGLTRFVRLERALCALVQVSVAMQNGCTFCTDLHLAEAVRARIGRERFRDLSEFESSPNFTAREKAALAYARALHESLHIPDQIWQRLGAQFSERERIDLVWICAVESYYNALALPLRVGSDHLADAG
jgi:AhpD family alkylhydroperoxidase